MKFHKTLARAAALILLTAPAAVALGAGSAGPASAATPVTTTTTISIFDEQVMTYGEGSALVEGSVTASDGSYVDGGTVSLQASPYPFRTWTTIYTTSPSTSLSYEVKPTISTEYRWVYTGYADPDTTQPSYAPSQTANPATQPVARKMSIQHRGLRMWGKVSPAKSRLKIVFEILKHHKLHKWFTVRTDKHGKWSKQIHGRVGTKFTVIVPTSAGYVGTHDEYSII